MFYLYKSDGWKGLLLVRYMIVDLLYFRSYISIFLFESNSFYGSGYMFWDNFSDYV